jgi:hypothetical protein
MCDHCCASARTHADTQACLPLPPSPPSPPGARVCAVESASATRRPGRSTPMRRAWWWWARQRRRARRCRRGSLPATASWPSRSLSCRCGWVGWLGVEGVGRPPKQSVLTSLNVLVFLLPLLSPAGPAAPLGCSAAVPAAHRATSSRRRRYYTSRCGGQQQQWQRAVGWRCGRPSGCCWR